jgi:cell division protease FtsH
MLRDKKQKNKNRKALAAVHEASHAVAHAVLFNMSPSQIVASPVSEDMEGFVYYSEDICSSKQMIRNRISVLLAGQEGEKIVFGELNQTSGASDDLRKATGFAASMARRWGFEAWGSQMYDSDKNDLAYNNVTDADSVIENIIKERRVAVRDLLVENKALLVDVVDRLLQFDKITPEEFKDVCAKHGLDISVSTLTEDVVYWDYHSKFEDYKKR